MCAIVAGRRGRNVIVLEGSNRIGKKILMSGGGRCNFTNIHCEPSRFLSSNPHFCKSALSRYTQWDFIALVEKHGIAYHEKTLGQLFCDNTSKDIVQALADECDAAGVTIHTDCRIDDVRHEDRFTLLTSAGNFYSESLVVASGGLSIPKMGASDLGYRIARQFGHTIVETRAGLVPFTFTGEMHELMSRLAGVSVRVTASVGCESFAENVLFTHRGLSGPAALQVSSYWRPGERLALDLLPGEDAAAALLRAKRDKPAAVLRSILAKQLSKALVRELQRQWWQAHAETPLGELADETLLQVGGKLNNWQLKPAATEGYRTAEVTLGGVDTAGLSSQTMESKLLPGLYFVGEVVDVTGHLGGFNFQWAWASGHAAGEVA